MLLKSKEYCSSIDDGLVSEGVLGNGWHAQEEPCQGSMGPLARLDFYNTLPSSYSHACNKITSRTLTQKW